MIEIKNLKAGYNGDVVLENLNFVIKEGEFIVILGRNGSGKTTLLKTISGFIKPIEGEIFIDGKNLNKINVKDIAKKFSYIGSEFEVSFPYTVYEVILMGRIPHIGGLWENKIDVQKAEQVIRELGLTGIKDKPFTELSSGEKQKTLLAQSLCKEPEVYLLDEPNIHLDVKETSFMFDVIKEEFEKGKTIISVLHDLNLALHFGKRFIFLKNRRIFYDGDDFDREVLESVYNVKFEIKENKNEKFLFPLFRKNGKR